LGGKWRDKVRAYGSTVFRPTPAAMKEAVKRYIAGGFTAVKFGWGVFGRDMCTDIKLVEAAREELGGGRDLLVDTGWFVERTPKEAIQWWGGSSRSSPNWSKGWRIPGVTAA